MKQISKSYVAVTVVTVHMVLLVSGYMPSAQQLLLYSLEHQSFLFLVRHNMDLPPPTVCQCLALITQPIVRLSRTLGPSTPRWRQLTPHNHQGQDNNLFVQDHLCLAVLLRLCQQWLSFSFHALGCGLYVAVPSLYVAVFVISCPVPLHFLPRASTLEMKRIEQDLIVRKNASQHIS